MLSADISILFWSFALKIFMNQCQKKITNMSHHFPVYFFGSFLIFQNVVFFSVWRLGCIFSSVPRMPRLGIKAPLVSAATGSEGPSLPSQRAARLTAVRWSHRRAQAHSRPAAGPPRLILRYRGPPFFQHPDKEHSCRHFCGSHWCSQGVFFAFFWVLF